MASPRRQTKATPLSLSSERDFFIGVMQVVRVGRHTIAHHSTRRRRDRHRHLRRRRGVVHRARRHAHDARVRKPERSAAFFLCVPDIFGRRGSLLFLHAKNQQEATETNERTPECPWPLDAGR